MQWSSTHFDRSKQQITEQLEHHATLHDNSQKASNFNHNFLGKGNFSKFHALEGTFIGNYHAIV